MDTPRTAAPERIIDYRPWGGFEQFTLNEPTTVKILWAEPGKRLSLQSHEHRSELWYVLEGILEAEVDGVVHRLEKGQEVFIPCGAKHRGSGTEVSARWLEIGFGTFDENDITRYQDDFGRS
jgi:mannose-6-phosphate isomerase-like protein (cupin superfamily)